MTFSSKRKSVSSKTKSLCQGLPYQGSCRADARLRGWTKDAFRVSGITQVLLCTTSPTSSQQLIQREPLAVTADFADCQSLSLWERCLRSRRRGQARQNETRKRSDTMSLTNRVCIAVRFAFCQHPCPLRRIRTSSPKGRASGEEALCISPIHTGIYYTDTTKWVGGNGICLW